LSSGRGRGRSVGYIYIYVEHNLYGIVMKTTLMYKNEIKILMYKNETTIFLINWTIFFLKINRMNYTHINIHKNTFISLGSQKVCILVVQGVWEIEKSYFCFGGKSMME